MKTFFKRALAVVLAVLMAFPNVSGFTTTAYAATYRNGWQSGPSSSYKSSKYYSNYCKVPITGDNVTDLLAIALSQLGYQEGDSNGSFSGEVSGSSNFTEYNYNLGDLGITYGYEWCASFVSWCLYQSRCTDQGTYSSLGRSHSGDPNYIWKEIGCGWWVSQLKSAGIWYNSINQGGSYTPESGDLIFFTYDGSSAAHIGIVLYVKNNTIYTVEGNTSDAAGLESNGGGVYFKSYATTNTRLLGFGHMPYKEDSSVADIDYSGANPTPGLYIAANSNKYIYTSETAEDYTYLLPRFSIFEVNKICSNGRLGGTFTINGETIEGYILNNEDRIIQLSTIEVADPTEDERAELKTYINQVKAKKHYNYSEKAINELRNTYNKAKNLVANNDATEAELQTMITELKSALANTGTNPIGLNNEGIYISGIDREIGNGDCILYTGAFNGDGYVSVTSANIGDTVNVVLKWNETLGVFVVQSVSKGTGNDTPAIQLASGECLIAAHDWETDIADSDAPIKYSGTNTRVLDNLKVGATLVLSGVNVENASLEPCPYAKFVDADAVRLTQRNESVEAGEFALFTNEFNSGVLTAANANIHKTLNVIAKWDNEQQAWYVTDKYVGNGKDDATIELSENQIVIAGLAADADDNSQINYNRLNAVKVGSKISFAGISPTTTTEVSFAANVSFEEVISEEEPSSEESTSETETTEQEESSSEEQTTEQEASSSEEEQTTKQEESSSEEETTEQVESSSEEETTEQVESSSEEETTEQEDTTSKEETTEQEESSSEEQTTEPIKSGITVHYYDTTGSANIYWWNAAPTYEKTTWPGVSMTAEGENWYTYTFENVTFTNLIFNNSTGQTADLTRETGEWWYKNGEWSSSKPSENTSTEEPGTDDSTKEEASTEEPTTEKLENSITGVKSSYKKSVNDSSFKLSVKANGTIRYKTSNTKVATVSSTGTVTIKGIGTATITITAGNGTYKTVSKKVTIKVVPAAAKLKYITSNAKKALSIKWEKMSGVSGFKIQYSTTSDFKNAKISYVGGSRHSKTRSDLKAGTKYYVRVCAYKKIGKNVYQGAWSNVKSYKVRSK